MNELRRGTLGAGSAPENHSLWLNATTGAVEAVPRHNEIPDLLARKICRGLGVPDPGSET
jgi:hypothetical protein